MKVYLVHNAPRGQRWQTQKVPAEKMARIYKGKVEPVLVAESGRDELASFLNSLDQFDLPARIIDDTRGPVRGVDGPFDMDDSGQPITDIPDAKPALSQADVDKMFEPSEKVAKLTPDDVDEICMLVEQMRGAAIGHVAHSLAARIERLGKEVQS